MFHSRNQIYKKTGTTDLSIKFAIKFLPLMKKYFALVIFCRRKTVKWQFASAFTPAFALCQPQLPGLLKYV